MPFIYADASGALVRITQNEDEDNRFGAPSGYAERLEFDPLTNAGTIALIGQHWTSFTLSGGVLRYEGQPVTINPPGDEYLARQDYKTNYPNLPDWVRVGTAAQAETYITAQILNGYTIAQAEAYVDTTIKNITTANVAQINAQLANIRTVFKLIADALIVMRGLFIITAKLLIYMRDLIIRFRGG